MSNKFHEHLNVCKRCREQPFNLCKVGSLILRAAIKDLELNPWELPEQ